MHRKLPLLIVLILSLNFLYAQKNGYSFEKGKLVFFKNPDLEKTLFQLDGEWEFYWNKTPEQIADAITNHRKPDAYIKVPSFWNKQIFQLSGTNDPHSSGCYRLVINNLEPSKDYAIFMRESPGTSSAIYINNQLLATTGDPLAYFTDTKKHSHIYKKSHSAISPTAVTFTSSSQGRAEILIFVTNHFYRKGGVWDTVYLGEVDLIYFVFNLLTGFYLSNFGILIFLSLLNLIQFFIKRSHKENFYMGVTSLIFAIRIATASYSSLNILFPSLPAEVKVKLEYMAMWLAPVCIIQMIRTLYPETRKYFLKTKIPQLTIKYIIIGITLAVGLASLLLPASLANHLVPVLQFCTGLCSIYVLSVIFSGIKNKRKHIIYYLISIFALVIGFILDFIFTKKKGVLPISSFPFFLVIFNMIQILLLAKIQYEVYLDTIRVSENLKTLNTAYLRFVPQEFLKLLKKNSILNINLGDHTKIEISIIFSKIQIKDLEKLTPEKEYQIFNDYQKEFAPVIRKNNGFISKFLSGGFIALFPNSPDDALAAAVEMNERMQILNQKYLEEGDVINTRFGLHYGNMILGTIGEENRLDDTVISDTVNTSARIESVCERLDKQIILSHAIKEHLAYTKNLDVELHDLEAISVKGKKKPLQLYECVVKEAF